MKNAPRELTLAGAGPINTTEEEEPMAKSSLPRPEDTHDVLHHLEHRLGYVSRTIAGTIFVLNGALDSSMSEDEKLELAGFAADRLEELEPLADELADLAGKANIVIAQTAA